MIVVHSSALIALLFDEPEKQALQDIVTGGERCLMSAVNVPGMASVLRGRLGPEAVAQLWQLLAECEIEIVPFDEAQVRAAAAAFDRFGKGIHSKACLNLADCAAYALATMKNAPL